jgi:hypothetical protein
MRRKPGHSMMSNTPSTHRSEGSPGLRAPPCRRMGWRKASLGPRKPRGRTSRPAPPAPDPHWTRSVCSGRQCHLPCRSPHGHKPEGRTTDAIGKAVRENRSRGCSQTSLYNLERPHEALDMDVPANRYQPSARSMPDKPAEVEYASDEIVRRVSANPHVSFKGRRWRVPKAFRGERLAIRPKSQDGHYGIFFGSRQVGEIDLTGNKSVCDVSEQVSAMSPD